MIKGVVITDSSEDYERFLFATQAPRVEFPWVREATGIYGYDNCIAFLVHGYHKIVYDYTFQSYVVNHNITQIHYSI